MTALDNLITVGVLLGLFILAYCRFTDRTLGDMFRDLKEAIQGEAEEIRL